MTAVQPAEDQHFEATVPLLVVGAGACGLTAAIAAREAGAEVVVLERDASPSGSTSLSSGFVPAAGTRFQAQQGIADSPAAFAADIQAKAKGKACSGLVRLVTEAAAPAIEWLSDDHGLGFHLVTGFKYPGHRVLRMHATPARTGVDLEARLLQAARAAGAEIMTSARVADLFAATDGRIRGLRILRPDGTSETLGCGALILASSGFGGDPDLVARHIPEMKDAQYFGHAGNRGEALRWGEALGAGLKHLGACQGHGSVATPHGILISWALMMEGGVQVNAEGRRFSDEHAGYSEQALAVLRQPGGVAWDVFDERLRALGLEFEDFRNAEAAGAIRQGATPEALAEATGLPSGPLSETLKSIRRSQAGLQRDPFGRDFTGKPPLGAPYYAVKVTGALFHTQGGLAVDDQARVQCTGGGSLPNLFAGGGAACGVSGPAIEGYLSGNGLLTAITLGRIAGRHAADLLRA
ncbi:MAG: FAD-dependent oxidoreductase [Kiloniellales bacterium]|nr:FAD-dependent oxidoreductase [Kiloniellales bacterium]